MGINRFLGVLIIGIFTILIINSFQSAHANTPVNPPVLNSYYLYNYNGQLSDNLNGVANPDGSLVIGGSSFIGDNSQIFLTKIDASGFEQWKKVYPSQVGYGLGFLITTSDGGYAATGMKIEDIPGTNSTGSNDDTLLIKTDSVGNLLWGRTYHIYGSNPDNGNGQFVQQTSDGGYILISFESNTGAFVMIKTDSNGIMEWNNTLPNTVGAGVREILEVSDGYLIPNRDNLCKLDLAGNVQWQKAYGLSLISYIIKSPDSGFVLLGNNGNEVSLVKMDSNYNLLWSKTYDNGRSQRGYFIKKTGAGGYIITGYDEPGGDVYVNDGPDFIFLLKIDDLGNQQWFNYYSQKDSLYGRGDNIYETDNGGYIVNGAGIVAKNPSMLTAWSPIVLILSPPSYPGELSFDSPGYKVNTTPITFSISVDRNNGTDGNVSVSYYTLNGSALPGDNYLPAQGMLNFSSGETSKTFNVTIFNSSQKNSLWLSLVLGNATGGAVLGEPSSVFLTIVKNDRSKSSSGIIGSIFQLFNTTGNSSPNKIQIPTLDKTISTIIPLIIGLFLGLFWPWLARLLQFLYDAVKSYLQKQFSTKEAKYRGITATPKKPWLFGVALAELFVGFACILLIGITFAYAKDYLLNADKLFVIIVAAGITIVVSEMARRFTARHYKAETEYKFWDAGAIILVITSLLHQPFSRPARTIINKPGELGARKQGIVAMAPCVVSLLLSIVFLLLLAYGNSYEMIGREGFKMGMMLCVYSLMPFEPMDGMRVIQWNKWVWGILFLPALAFYLGMLLFVL